MNNKSIRKMIVFSILSFFLGMTFLFHRGIPVQAAVGDSGSTEVSEAIENETATEIEQNAQTTNRLDETDIEETNAEETNLEETNAEETNIEKAALMSETESVIACNALNLSSNGKYFYADSNGTIVTTANTWIPAGSNYYYNAADGYVSDWMKKSDGYWKYYCFDASSGKWIQKKNVWKLVNGNNYYFDSSGNCTRVYYPDTKKSYNDVNQSWVLNQNTYIQIGIQTETPRYYLFGANGVLISATGWYKLNGSAYIYVGANGYVTNKLVASSATWKFYSLNYNSGTWTLNKNVWNTIDGVQYYFNSDGNASRKYSAGYCYDYDFSKNTWIMKKNTSALIGKNYYYFSATGKIDRTTGWKQISTSSYVYVDNAGHITHKMNRTSNYWQYYSYDAEKAIWTLYRCKWQTVDGVQYYFNADGKSSRKYTAGYCYDYNFTSNTWVMKKNAVASVGSHYYFFSANGKIDRTTGWKFYDVINERFALVDNSGYVVRHLYYSGSDYYCYNYTGLNMTPVNRSLVQDPIGYYYYFVNGKAVKKQSIVQDGYYYYMPASGKTCYRSKYKYDVKIMNNPEYTLYTNNSIILFIQTDNPDTTSITVKGQDSNKIVTYDDIQYLDNFRTSGLNRVRKGYFTIISFEEAGTHTVTIFENMAKIAEIDIYVQDYKTARQEWYQSILDEVTDDSMTDYEKMDAICNYILANFKYLPNDSNGYLRTFVTHQGAFFEVKEIDCIDAAGMMCSFASLLGLECEKTYAGYLNHYYAKVYINGTGYIFDATPQSDNIIDNWDYVL